MHQRTLLKVCSHLTFAFASTSPSKFNIVSMETRTQMHRMGLNPFLTFSIDAVLNFDSDIDANANVKCEHTLNQRVFYIFNTRNCSCGKVMFSQLSVCPQLGGGSIPGPKSLPGDRGDGTGIPEGYVLTPSGDRHNTYGWQAGGTRLTGMLSCCSV